MPVTTNLLAVSIFSVTINGTPYLRKDLTVTLNSGAGTLAVEAGVPVLLPTVFGDIAAMPGSPSGFASYAAMAAWVALYLQDNVKIVDESTINEVYINEVAYVRSVLKVTLDDTAETLRVLNGSTVLIDTVYSNIVETGIGAFASYAAMKAWVLAHLKFYGQNIESDPDWGYLLINSKPYAKGVLYYAWDDVAETLEIRNSPGDYQYKPLPATVYSNIVNGTSTTAFASYQDLIDFIKLYGFRPI